MAIPRVISLIKRRQKHWLLEGGGSETHDLMEQNERMQNEALIDWIEFKNERVNWIPFMYQSHL
jgi:hypothetical protein